LNIEKYPSKYYEKLPVNGASISIIVFSWRMIAAPSFIIRKATSSETRPSAMKCSFNISGLGLPLASKTSLIDSLLVGGNGTPTVQERRL